MTDFITCARETAEREAKERYGENMLGHRQLSAALVAGFTTAVSRLPSEEEIELAILGRTATAGARAVRELIEKKMLQ